MSATAQDMIDGNECKLLQELIDIFHSFLDEALIVAIAGDFDLKNASDFKQARSTLEDLAQSVPTEEVSGFNSCGVAQAVDGVHKEDSHQEQTITTTTTTTTSATSTSTSTSTRASHGASRARAADKSSTDTSLCGLDSPGTIPRLISFNKNSEEDKILALQEMFAELKPYDVKYAVKKACGDFQIALDDLLNIQYLQSTGQQLKGIDGFFVNDSATNYGKKKKREKKSFFLDPEMSSGDGVSSPRIPLEVDVQEDVEYIAERFGIPPDEVTPVYHSCQRSKGATVVELLRQYISHGVETQDEIGKEAAEALMKKYRHVPTEFMPTIVHVTGAIPQFSEDVAALLNRHFSKQSKGKKVDLTYRLTPLPEGEIEGSALSQGFKSLQPSMMGVPASLDLKSVEEITKCASMFHQAGRDASSAAAQLYRRGASSPLYRQAAGYYSDRAREQASYAQNVTSTAADLLVDQQSTHSSIDLHGVLVHDGVRIALKRVQEWWQSLGDMRATKLREQGGFTVITGLGRHNAGGVSRLRQAVAAALLQDGWRIRIETGKFVIVGRR